MGKRFLTSHFNLVMEKVVRYILMPLTLIAHCYKKMQQIIRILQLLKEGCSLFLKHPNDTWVSYRKNKRIN
jgi:hypothetical protein